MCTNHASSNRPTSSVFETAQTPVKTQPGEGKSHRDSTRLRRFRPQPTDTHLLTAHVYDKWLDDIEKYEATLENMASASLDSNFKEELGAIEQWFRVLSEAERTATLYSLLQHATTVQIRFFIMILQQMSRQDPMSAVLSPANFTKDLMSEHLNNARVQMSMRSAATPGFMASAKQFDPSTISQMFPNAAAALAHQRAELNRKKNLATPGPTPDVVLQPPANTGDGAKTPWTPSFRRQIFEGPTRPRSAEPAKSALDGAKLTPGFRAQPRNDLLGANLPFSPFGEFAGPTGNWASITNTPVSAMFPQSNRNSNNNDTSAAKLAQRLSAASLNPGQRNGNNLAAPNNSANTAARVIIDNDVRKYRRDSRKGDETKSPANPASPLLIYDDDGQLMSPESAQLHASPLVQRQMVVTSTTNNSFNRSNSASPVPTVNVNANSTPSAWMGAPSPFARAGQQQSIYDSTTQDAHADTSMLSAMSNQGRRRSSNNGHSHSPSGGSRHSATGSGGGGGGGGGGGVQENPADARLLNDLPAWLRHLRLHKYTDNFRGIPWQKLVELDDEQLQQKGVSALGARRKLLKAFETVQEAVAAGRLSK